MNFDKYRRNQSRKMITFSIDLEAILNGFWWPQKFKIGPKRAGDIDGNHFCWPKVLAVWSVLGVHHGAHLDMC